LDFERREYRLAAILESVEEKYDYVVIDCPPSLNMLTINALVAADRVIIPMQCEYYALEGLSALMQTIDIIKGHLNPDLEIEGVVRTMYDPRNRLTIEVNNELFNHLGQKVYRTVIPRNVRLAEAPSFGLPVIQYDRQSKGAIAYLALAGELLRRADEKKALKCI
jgi:chromosome partitioning protein